MLRRKFHKAENGSANEWARISAVKERAMMVRPTLT